MRFFFHIAYKGTQYRGWQRQPNVISVQEIIENVLSKLFSTNVIISGCGRTDAEVHASQYFFHLDLKHPPRDDTIFIINKQLPHDIVLHNIIPVASNANARFDAVTRTYDYYIHFKKQAFLNEGSSLYEGLLLNPEFMQAAMNLLLEYDDFRGFCKSPDVHNTTICHFESARLFEENGMLRLEFKANRFLRGMIRIIVFRLIAVGSKGMTLKKFENYLITKASMEPVQSAYPQGLYLSHIKYPFLDIPKRSPWSSVAF